MTAFVCKRIPGYSKIVVRVWSYSDEELGKVVGTFSFEPTNFAPIHSPHPYDEESLAAQKAAQTFLEVGE